MSSTETEPVAVLVELIAGGQTVDRAETQAGLADGTARPALVGWARSQGMGYAALAKALGLPRNTVKSWWHRHAAEPPAAPPSAPRGAPRVRPAAAPPRASPSPPPASEAPTDRGGSRSSTAALIAEMDREEYLCWVVSSVAGRLESLGPMSMGTYPQLVAQLRAARNELDLWRQENRTRSADLHEGLTEEELLEKLQDAALEMPEAHLEVVVQVYLDRTGMRLMPLDAQDDA